MRTMFRKRIFILAVLLLPVMIFAALPHKSSSVLATGHWYKLAVAGKGIHRITYGDLVSMGITPATLDVTRLRLFGNGSGMLPETNSITRTDDLREIAIEVADGGDGHFDSTDYILFYGEDPDKWSYEGFNKFFSHTRNLYSDSTCYFLNTDLAAGRRVQVQPAITAAANNLSGRFDDYQLHELDLLNLIKSGKEWYGEFFDNVKNSWDFPFTFPNADSTAPVKLRTYVAANASVPSYFIVSQHGKKIDSLKVDSSDPAEYTQVGFSKIKQSSIANPHPDQTITLTYKLPDVNSHGWLNFIEINCPRYLKWVNPQMPFRDLTSIGVG